MNNPRFYVGLALVCALILPLQAESGMSSRLRSYVHTIDTAEEPRVIEGHLVLTYSSPHPVRYVAASFEQEEYTVLHIYRINQNGVFVLTYPLSPLPKETEKLKYRIIVDGLWMRDPRNRRIEPDHQGIPISVVELPRRPVEIGETPRFLPDGRVEFIYTGRPGSRVTVAADFNRWSPFSHPLVETASGIYRLPIRLYEGSHRYSFYIDGARISDPRNPRVAYDKAGTQVSTVVVPPPALEGKSLADGG